MNFLRAQLQSKVTSNRTRGKGLRLCQRRFRMDFRKNFITAEVVVHWSRMPRKAMESPFLSVSKNDRTWQFVIQFSGLGSICSNVGLDDFVDLFQP